MKMVEYVKTAEVKRVCKEIGIRDWSMMKKAGVTLAEARKILKHLDTGDLAVSAERFRAGLEVELEHGTMFPEYNVTNNHPLLTGKIVMAHFMEMADYYERLEVAELEGDLLKALNAGDLDKARSYYKRMAKAREELAITEQKIL